MNSIGRYQLVEKLGQGGMGVVYRGFDTLLQRVVAVKLISGAIESGTEQRERFFREARAAGQLSHRNIITIYDLGEHENRPYLAMEYLEGEDLQHRLARPDRMSLHRKVEIAMEICEGLEFAHSKGVVHRDIKPANIFITDNGTVKILDFGLARLVTSELTNSKVMMGTINYMAPEQVRGERADQRSDIFALGVVLYELLGGRKAFDGESVAATLYKIVQQDPEPLLQINPDLPPELVAIVDRALAKPRDERYQQISEMLRDLAVYRQQMIAHDSGRPGSGGHGRHPISRLPTPQASEALTIPHAPTPQPSAPPAPAIPGSGQAAASRRRPTRALLGIAAGLLLIGAIGVWVWRTAEPPTSPAAAAPAADAQALEAALEQASRALEAGDPAEAQRHADAALALAPDDREARRLRDQSAGALDTLRENLREAQTHFEAGRFEEASRAAGNVLTITPDHPEARQLMQESAARLRGQGAVEARNRMNQAKTAARAAAAADLAPAAYTVALSAERAAQRAFDSGELVDATARFYEASGLFRSAEVSAQSEAALRSQRAEAARREKERAEQARLEDERLEKERADKERADKERADKERARAAASPPPPAPATPRPEPAATDAKPAPAVRPQEPEKPQPPPDPPAEQQIAELIRRYEAALESRNIEALKRLWPSLAGAQESAIRNEFAHASRIEVGITSPQVDVTGPTATATFVRQYDLVTTDGQRLASRSVTTMTCRRTAAGWVIEQVRFEPIR